MVTKDLETLNLKFDQVMLNSLVLTWKNFEVTFGIFSVLVYQLSVLRSTQRAVLQNSCSTVGVLLGKFGSSFVSCWQDEIHQLGDFFKNFLLKGHYRREAAKIFFKTLDNL